MIQKKQNNLAISQEFWKKEGKRIDWFTEYSKVNESNFSQGHIKWFSD